MTIHYLIKNQKMQNKKAFIRIVEAVIAIMIIITAVLLIANKQPKKTDISESIYEKQRQMLEIISNNEDMRNEIINSNTILTNEFILKNIPESWDFITNICDTDQLCNQNTPNDRDVYVSETIMSATLTNYPNKKSKKLMFFIWRK